MIYEICVKSNHVSSIVKEFPDCITEQNKESADFTNIKIDIFDSVCLVRLFYCGVEAGIREFESNPSI